MPNQGSLIHLSGVTFVSNFSSNLKIKKSTEEADESKRDLQFGGEKTCESRFTWQKLSWRIQRQTGKTLCRYIDLFPLRLYGQRICNAQELRSLLNQTLL